MARRGRLGGDRARQPALRLPVERRARRARGRDRHRRARRAHGVLGAAVRDAGLGRGAARATRPRPTFAASRACTRRPGTRASRAGRQAARANAHRATELELDARYDACEPGYASFVEALGNVYCGDLDRYVELTGAVAERYGSDRGYGLASYVDGLQSARPDRGGARARRGVRRRGAIARQPLLDLLRAVDRRDGVLEGGRPPGVRGVGRGRRVRARAPRPVLRGLPRARRGPPAHLRRRARGRARAVRRRHRRVPPGRQRAAADHHAGERAGAVRAPRPLGARGDAPRRAVARAVERPPRSRARSTSAIGSAARSARRAPRS